MSSWEWIACLAVAALGALAFLRVTANEIGRKRREAEVDSSPARP